MKYGELMDKIELTPEMRERVLAGVERKLAGGKAGRRSLLRRGLPLVACLALVITAVLALPRVTTPGVDVVPGME